LKQIADQHRFAPANVRITQMDRAEELAFDVQVDQVYRYPELHLLITNHRSELFPDLEITGQDLLHDLRYYLEELSNTVDQNATTVDEPVFTVDEISEQLSVSTKTIQRWRTKGLPSRRLRIGSRKRVAFRQSCVERFIESHSEELDRSSRFTQLSEQEREDLVRRARRLARAGATLTEVTVRLSRRTGRAIETIRYTLRNFDRDYPDAAIFAQPVADIDLGHIAPQDTSAAVIKELTQHSSTSRDSSLSLEAKRDIYRLRLTGTSSLLLAAKFGRSKSSIYRIASEYRAHLLFEQTIDYIEADQFHEPDADDMFLQEPDSEELKMIWGDADPVDQNRPEPGNNLPVYLADLYACPVLTQPQEQYLFRRLHYLRFKADKLRKTLRATRPNTELMDHIESILEESNNAKNALIRFNLRLVVSIARKHRSPAANFFDMISDGNMTLIRAIEKFDFRRGTKFSTYATWALMRSYARSVPAEGVHQTRFQTGADAVLIDSTDERTSITEDEKRSLDQRETIESILDQLNEREQEAISLRFALKGHAEPLTLEQIGDRLGVSKERTRQIINAGLAKLRESAKTTNLSLPFDD
jgi:RNA polymerase primary sigma factor